MRHHPGVESGEGIDAAVLVISAWVDGEPAGIRARIFSGASPGDGEAVIASGTEAIAGAVRAWAQGVLAEVAPPEPGDPRMPGSAEAVVRVEQRQPFVTRDGSSIRELAGLPSGNAAKQSLAQATVPPGGETEEHFHRETEEIYLFTGGSGRMRLGEDEFGVGAGDCVVIAPCIPHKLWSDEGEPLVLMCCCAPPYRHEDTVLTGR